MDVGRRQPNERKPTLTSAPDGRIAKGNQMTHFSSYLFFRFIRAFQQWNGFQAADIPSGETRKLELVKEVPWTEGAAGIVKFNGTEYLVQIRPIISQVKVEKPLTYSDFEKTGGKS